jgi:hypothetical protein
MFAAAKSAAAPKIVTFPEPFNVPVANSVVFVFRFNVVVALALIVKAVITLAPVTVNVGLVAAEVPAVPLRFSVYAAVGPVTGVTAKLPVYDAPKPNAVPETAPVIARP